MSAQLASFGASLPRSVGKGIAAVMGMFSVALATVFSIPFEIVRQFAYSLPGRQRNFMLSGRGRAFKTSGRQRDFELSGRERAFETPGRTRAFEV